MTCVLQKQEILFRECKIAQAATTYEKFSNTWDASE